ncbi:FidL-like protein [Erwinia sp. JUb26]|uniref:FidL-like protein n=1 Tax=Erwinia sp. JUb26 TaxID=2485126 RepID=UPI000F49FCA4|nr:FidL-like protein [Erwinia sp. JUb26]ROR13463.1 FidL-like putative membrane protein [Erwinia sp. JUb26]
MRNYPKSLFTLSLLIFSAAAAFTAWRLVPQQASALIDCSARVIMRFENMDQENVNGTVHFNFGSQGEGSMVVEGYTDSERGSLYLQRYVKFTYNIRHISAAEKHYIINQWQASASTIDRSPDIIFDYFMREMSDSRDGLFLNARWLSSKAVMLSSINSPLYICTLKSDNAFN